jgi:hypothetical protein
MATNTGYTMDCFQQIPVEADLPVGNNLQDHLLTIMDFYDNSTSAVNIDKLTSPMHFIQYFTSGSGIHTYSIAFEYVLGSGICKIHTVLFLMLSNKNKFSLLNFTVIPNLSLKVYRHS